MKALIAATLFAVQVGLCAPVYQVEEIHSFPPGSNSSSGPWAGLTRGGDGAFYGTTRSGGDNGYGSVFRLTADGQFTTLVSFAITNGVEPQAPLIAVGNGVLLGSTSSVANNNFGLVFSMTTNGALTILANFTNYLTGAVPTYELVRGLDGSFYGTTATGGHSYYGYGTVFRLTTNWVLTTLAHFEGTNGYLPDSNLLVGEDGALYGTTLYGGTGATGGGFGPGNLYRVTMDGALTNVFEFSRTGTNGNYPRGRIAWGRGGSIYGTTTQGGSGDFGTVFRVSTNGVIKILADLSFGTLSYGLTESIDGAFYATYGSGGGVLGVRGLFRVTTNGLLTTIVSFANTNYTGPRGAVVLGSDGAFYGTTYAGGSLGGGAVFRVVVFSHIESVVRQGSAWNVKFTGVSGETYRLERSTNISGSWVTLTNITLGTNQSAQFLDNSPPAGEVFYRTVVP